MNVLITVGSGFIYSSIAHAFLEQGHNVLIVDNYITGKKENDQYNIKHTILKISIRIPI
jgi:nucleoside-diphosphate-sugar epimerase